jgi:hypothetical protein
MMSKPGLRTYPGTSLGVTRFTGPGGIRYRGSMTPTEALLWNV